MLPRTLTILGCGIKFSSHFTTEFISYVESASKVLFLVNNAVFQEWINTKNSNAESLEFLYFKAENRQDNYRAISEYILKSYERSNGHVCAIFYGHPLILSDPAFLLVKLAKEKGYPVKVIPGISSSDCLFADLMIDPSDRGYQSYETTHFLLYPKKLDVCSHLILWQVGSIGRVTNPKTNNFYGKHIGILKEALKKFYPSNHKIFLYEAAQYPYFDPVIQTIILNDLEKSNISPLTTMYIPPCEFPEMDLQILDEMGLSISATQD